MEEQRVTRSFGPVPVSKKKKDPLGMVNSGNYFFLVAHSTAAARGCNTSGQVHVWSETLLGQSAALSLLSIDQRMEATGQQR